MLQNPLVNRLLHNLEDAVFDYRIAVDEAGCGSRDFTDEVVGAEGVDDGVSGAVNEGTADHSESAEEGGVSVAYVGEGDGVVVAPGR